MPRICVSILSESRLFRDALSARLAREHEIEVAGAASSVHQLLVRAHGQPIEVLLAHASTESVSGRDVVWEIRTLLCATHVIVLGLGESGAEILRWVEAGAMACLDDETPYAALLKTIRAVAQGRPTWSLSVLTRALQHRTGEPAGVQVPEAPARAEQPLSYREKEVARLLRFGLVDKRIARQLGIKRTTVKTYVQRILRKLQLRGRRNVLWGWQEGGAGEED